MLSTSKLLTAVNDVLVCRISTVMAPSDIQSNLFDILENICFGAESYMIRYFSVNYYYELANGERVGFSRARNNFPSRLLSIIYV